MGTYIQYTLLVHLVSRGKIGPRACVKHSQPVCLFGWQVGRRLYPELANVRSCRFSRAFVVQGLVRTGNSGDNCSSATFGALMNACEKAGQWDLAIALFDKMCAHGCRPDVGIFNLMIAACAHGGEYLKARVMFDR